MKLLTRSLVEERLGLAKMKVAVLTFAQQSF